MSQKVLVDVYTPTSEPLCRRLAGSESISTAPACHATSGEAFDIAIYVLRRGESLEAATGEAGEEVAAVLEGAFTIHAAGEIYHLSKGEGIIIPSAEPRQWTCDTEAGRLYRVVNRASLVTPTGAAT